MSDFVHLHVHSHYSLLDGLSKIDELVKTAKKRGFSALALTDHGNMYGAIEFYQRCLKEGIKPIIGMEAYLAPGSRFEKNGPDNKYFHLVLLALNYTGYRNLMKLTSLANLEGFYYKPRLDKELLKKYHEGLVATSACFGGEIPHILRKENNFAKAKKVALEYQEIFGPENFYLEMMDLPSLSGQMELNSQLQKLSKETGIPLIVTRDAHYLNTEDAEAQDILTCIRDGRTIEDPNRASMASVDCSLAPAKEIAGRFKHIPEAMANTVKIADRVNLVLELDKWIFPPIDIPPGITAEDYLTKEVLERLPKLIEMTPEVKKRAEYELDVINKKGYAPYFIAVADYVNYARNHGIMETTRGSGAGSIVSYAMGITTVNPLYFNLPFERFLNPFRPSPPDIDCDFADDRREEIIKYVTDKYGADRVAQIITFGTMMARGAVRDTGRALGYSYTFCDQISKMIPMGSQGFPMTIAKALEVEKDLKDLYEKNPQAHRLIDLAQKIEGCARHSSMHAAGVVISPTPLTDYTPIQFETGGEHVITQYDMYSIEPAGVLKMDFLGIRNLSILGHAVEIIEKTANTKIDLFNIPWDDKKTYEMLARGETVGLFQLAGSGMTRYLKELIPSTIFDIMAMIALFRPGPMANIPEYIARKHGHSPITYLHPKMANYLDKSFGILVYQDDLMFTAMELAGYDWTTVDKFRKAIGKKIPEEMAKQHEIFVTGCQKSSGMTKEKAEQMWNLFEPFQGYGFNKAHAASYAVVAYQTAYLKANFPVQYMTAVLIAESGDIDKVPEIIHECGKMGIEVLPPDVNESFKNFAMIGWENGGKAHIRFGLQGVKNVGEHIAEVIYRERKLNGKYKDFEDLLRRIKDKDLNKKSLESLAKCGALDCFGYDRGMLLANTENIMSFVHASKENAISNQNSLFSGTGIDLNEKVRLDAAPAATEDEKMKWEKELLGVYVTANPFAYYEQKLKGVITPLRDAFSAQKNGWATVGGMVDSIKKKITKNGQTMLFVTIQDLSDKLELLVFPKSYEVTKNVWMEGQPVAVLGKAPNGEGDDKLFVEKACLLDKENCRSAIQNMLYGSGSSPMANVPADKPVQKIIEKGLEISATPEEIKTKSDDLKKILKNHSGQMPVYLSVKGKKIKTSYKVNSSSELKQEVEGLLGIGRVK